MNTRDTILTITAMAMLSGCATASKALSVATCGVADPRLGMIVTDPPAVIEYFNDKIETGRAIAAGLKSGDESVSEEAAAWVEDSVDLAERLRACVPE